MIPILTRNLISNTTDKETGSHQTKSKTFASDTNLMSCLNAPQWFRAQLLVEVSIGKMNNFCNFCDVASAKLKNLSGPTRNLKDLVPGFDHMFWGVWVWGKLCRIFF